MTYVLDYQSLQIDQFVNHVPSCDISILYLGHLDSLS
jgi:hypothetical protein